MSFYLFLDLQTFIILGKSTLESIYLIKHSELRINMTVQKLMSFFSDYVTVDLDAFYNSTLSCLANQTDVINLVWGKS